MALTPLGCGQPPGMSAEPSESSPRDTSIALEREKARLAAAKWHVRVDVQFIELPEARALELLPDLRSEDAQKVAAAVTQLRKMIDDKEATLEAWPEVIGLDGARLVCETVKEKRYAAAFAPPPSLASDPATTPEAPTRQPDDADIMAMPPTAFETRNVGVTLSVLPHVIEDGRRLLLSEIVADRVALLRFDPFDGGIDSSGRQILIEQPQFGIRRTQTSVSMRNGDYLFLNIHKADPEKQTAEVLILHAIATKVQ